MTRALPEVLARRLTDAERWLVLTGAGISADSGIPTFRESQTGLWANYDPLELATPEAFRQNPALVWNWYRWRRRLIAAATPSTGHIALAELAVLRPGLTLVTQNVDGLHERAGSRDVIEFHGNITRTSCFDCGALSRVAEHVGQHPPRCPHCGGLLRPDVVWFGEAIPRVALEASFAAAAAAEIFLAIGTSALVYPAAGLADAAAAAGATLIEVNPSRTPLSGSAGFVLEGTAADWLPAIAAMLR